MDLEIYIYILPLVLGGICGIIIGFIEFCNIYKAKNSQNIQRIPGIVDLIVTQNSRYPIGLPMVEFVYKGTKVRKRIILIDDIPFVVALYFYDKEVSENHFIRYMSISEFRIRAEKVDEMKF